MLSGIIKQIIVITDGQSNQGGCPVAAATRARGAGITVSAVGILDSGRLGDKGAVEVSRIAEAGGGIHHLVPVRELAYTISGITVQTTQLTVRQQADRKLLQLTGMSLNQFPPEVRSTILPYIARQEEEAEVHIALVLDTSGSMLQKRAELEDSIKDLVVSLDSRKGPVKLAIVQYPGRKGRGVVIKSLYGDNSVTLKVLEQMVYGGFTPTGPAIDLAAGVLTGSTGIQGNDSVVAVK